MIGLCFEAETKCSSCGLPLPINALVETIVCSQCSSTNKFTVDDWKSLLEDMFEEAPNFEEGDGTESTVMGSRNYNITYGRQNPKFADTKSYIDMEVETKNGSTNKIVNPSSGIEYSIRPVPENLKNACPYVTYLVCEDFSQLPGNKEGSMTHMNSPHQLVPFTCPNCAGTLQLSNDSQRKLKCNFCSTESFIPDEIWQKLHPTKKKSRFYFWLDEDAMPFKWEDDIWDIVVDAEGTIYISLKAPFHSDDGLWVLALNPNLTVKWRRGNLKFKTGGDSANMELTANGELVLWHSDRNTILLLSCADGSEIKRVGKKTEGTYNPTTTLMDFAYCRNLASDIDGNYIAWAYFPTEPGVESNCELKVIDKEGTLHKPWGLEDAPKGFFGSIKKALSNMSEVQYLEKLKDGFTKCKDYDVELAVGHDGSYYLEAHSKIAKYNREGEQIYLIKMEDGYIPKNVVGDKMGNAFFVLDQDDKCVLKKVSPDGKHITNLVESVLDGGFICEENMVALSPNGNLYCVGYSGRFRIFDSSGKLLYASERSLEEEADKKKEAAEKED